MRRFPFPALLACTTCAVLLVGCESPAALHQSTSSTPPTPTQQSLSFEIAGPSRIDADGPFSWDAFAFGGSGQYQYRWEVTRQAGQATTTTSGPSLSLHVTDTDGDIVLRLTVTSGTQTRVETLAVKNCIGGC